MHKITLEEFDRLKSEFDELYSLIEEDNQEGVFADGTRYSEEEVINRMAKINDSLCEYDLSDIPAERFGDMLILAANISDKIKGLAGTGANIDFSLMEENYENMEWNDVRGCNLINLDFDKIIISDKFVDERVIEEHREYFLERPLEKDSSKNEAIDRYYSGEMTIEDIILLKDELSDRSKKIKWGYKYDKVVEKLGVERFIALLEREPVYMQNFIVESYSGRAYLAVVTDEMDVDEIIDAWFDFTKTQIKISGIHRLSRSEYVPLGDALVDIDVRKYGDSFIKANPEFFVEDKNLPEEIKQKFYNGKLSFDEFLQYEDEFEGIMVGIGIDSAWTWHIGRTGLDDLIKFDKEAIVFLEQNPEEGLAIKSNLSKMVSGLNYDKEELKDELKKGIESILYRYRVGIFNNDIDIKGIYGQSFLRERLSELFLPEEAPDGLKNAFYNKVLTLDDLRYNPDWLPWLEGKEEYIKHCCIKNRDYREWAHNGIESSLPEEIEEYMRSLYNSEIREDRLKGNYIREGVLEGSFREKHPELFFDDLPEELQKLFIQRNMLMEDFFDLPQEQKEQLRGKEITMLIRPNIGQADFLRRVGGSFEDFEIYEKYRGILWAAMAEINSNMNYFDYERNIKGFIENKEIEELIKVTGLKAIKTREKGYDDRVPEDFKKENEEYFLDTDAPEELKWIFYRQGGVMDFAYLQAHHEFLEYLEGKDIQHCFSKEYELFFQICGSQDLARELGVKYGDEVCRLDFESFLKNQDKDLTKEEVFKKIVYESIENRFFTYYEDMPEDFKNQYPELFLSQDDLDLLSETLDEDEIESIKKTFYSQTITFDYIRKYPQLGEIIKNKNFKAIITEHGRYLWDLCDGDIEKIWNLGDEYGDVLLNARVRIRAQENSQIFKDEDILGHVDFLIHDCIVERGISDRDSMPDKFKYLFHELFILPEDLEKITDVDQVKRQMLKERFYLGVVSFQDLNDSPEFKEVIKTKDIHTCMIINEVKFLEDFTALLDGDRDKAINLASGRFATQLDGLLGNGVADELNIDKILAFYKEMKFIPHPAVVKKLLPSPLEEEEIVMKKVKAFALNSKLWGKLMSIPQYTSHSDYIGSMLEAAMVMGVFETKEFVKNGEVRVQGAGQEGFEKLQKLLNHTSKYDRNPPDILKEEGKVEFVGHGYVKTSPDFEDELIYEEIEEVALDLDLNDELIQGGLTIADAENIVRDMHSSEGIERFFVSNGDGTYRCKIDRNSNTKVKVLFETLGIKDDSVLSEYEFRMVKACNRDYISRAFVKTEDGYRFNMAKIGENFVIGNNTEIDENQSKENKRLFDYVKFLMMEYGLEDEGGRLTANNDRSNINLVLNAEKMEEIARAADEVSDRAQRKYSYQELWIAQEDVAAKTFRPQVLHQVFDGLDMVYNKKFSEFILENAEEIALNNALVSKTIAMQEAVIRISQDPDYSEFKITPEVVLKAMSKRKYLGKKTGFEKGEELAQKFSFTQEQFEFAQQIWEEARGREASSIPRIEGKENEYSYEVLRLDDATGIFIGNITNCCQKVGGAGETAMLHSMTEKNGRVFVVRDANNKIIAQSWLWRNGNTICFDNVEIPNSVNNKKNQDMAYEVLRKAGKELCEKDKEVLEELVSEGKIDKDKAGKIRAMKVTVGRGNTDINDIRYNTDSRIEDKERKFPIEQGKNYNNDSLYVSDSRTQVILYQDEEYVENSDVFIPTLALHRDENVEKTANEISRAELKTIEAIDCEIDSEVEENYENVNTVYDFANMYGVEPEELKLVMGTDWLMLYSENEENIEVHKMLRSPSSGIIKKSVREQKKAVKRLMDKAAEQNKSITMEIENDRVYEATKTMIKHAKKNYEMTVEEEKSYGGRRIEISGIESR